MWRLLLLALIAVAAAFACSWHYPIWIPRSQSADPLYQFDTDRGTGYIDAKGRVVIAPVLGGVSGSPSEFHDGLRVTWLGSGKYLDRTGKVVLDLPLETGWDFSEGLAAAMRKGENLWGYIDTTGKFAIPPRFPSRENGYVSSFSEGVAMINSGGRFGFIDRSGEFVIPPQFLDATSFADGMARVVVEGPCKYNPDDPCGDMNTILPGVPAQQGPSAWPNWIYPWLRVLAPSCKFTYINKSGTIITQQRFKKARDFSEGMAPVQVGTLWGFIDRTGSLVIAPAFEDAAPFSSGLSRILVKGQYGYVDKSGKVAIRPQFKYAESFSDGLAVVGDGADRYWYINNQGQRSFAGDFAVASPFFKGLAHVLLRSEDAKQPHAYIDTKGTIVFRY